MRHYVVGVDTSTSQRSPWLRQLPPTVVTEVRRRRSAILAGVTGRVLDLDTPGALTLVEAAAGGDGVADDERYDTIVCTCRLIEVPDLLRAATGQPITTGRRAAPLRKQTPAVKKGLLQAPGSRPPGRWLSWLR